MLSSSEQLGVSGNSVAPSLWGTFNQAPTTLAQAWRRSILLLIAAFLIVSSLFWQTLVSMTSIWKFGTYSHGYLIFPICCWLIWRERERLLRMVPTIDFAALPVIGSLGVLWLIGELAEANAIKQVAVVALIPTLVWALLGLNTVSRIWFPLLYLAFAVPLGDSLIPRLQDFTAWFTVSALRATGIPAVLENRFIYISSGTWEVAEACSGMRYLISSVALGTLFAYLYYRSWGRRFAFIAASTIVPILANGARAYTTVLFAHTISLKMAVGIDHLIYGWLFFSAVMLCLLGLAFVWRAREQREKAPVDDFPEISKSPGKHSLTASITVLLLGMLMLSGVRAWAYSIRDIVPLGSNSVKPLSVSGPWMRLESSQRAPIVTFENTDSQSSAAFSDGSHVVRVYIAYYRYQRPNAELITLNNGLDKLGHVRTLQNSTLNVSSLALNEAIVARPALNEVVWYSYWVDGQWAASASRAKVLRAKAELFGQRRDAAAIFISTDILSSSADAQGVLRQFLEDAHLSEMFGTVVP